MGDVMCIDPKFDNTKCWSYTVYVCMSAEGVIFLEGSGGMLPQKYLKIRVSFRVF